MPGLECFGRVSLWIPIVGPVVGTPSREYRSSLVRWVIVYTSFLRFTKRLHRVAAGRRARSRDVRFFHPYRPIMLTLTDGFVSDNESEYCSECRLSFESSRFTLTCESFFRCGTVLHPEQQQFKTNYLFARTEYAVSYGDKVNWRYSKLYMSPLGHCVFVLVLSFNSFRLTESNRTTSMLNIYTAVIFIFSCFCSES